MTTNVNSVETAITIAWYKVSADKDGDVSYDTVNSINEILKLPGDPKVEPNRYRASSANRSLYIDDPLMFSRMGKVFTIHQVIRDKLPEVDNAGKRRDLTLNPDEGLAHTAVCLLVEDELLSIAFTNDFRPSIKQLELYIKYKRQKNILQGPVIRPVIHKDALRRLITTGDLVSANLMIRAGAVTILQAEGNELFPSMQAALQLEPTTREIPLAWFPQTRTGFKERVQERFRSLLNNPRTIPHLNKMQGKVRVPNESRHITIDVLSDRLTEKITVQNPNPQSARLEIIDVVAEIEASFDRLSEDINESVGAEIKYVFDSEQLPLL